MLASELEKNSNSFSPPDPHRTLRSPPELHRTLRSPSATVCRSFVTH